MAIHNGTWSEVSPVPVLAIHGALIYNSNTDKWKVMFFDGGRERSPVPRGANDYRKSHLWDPSSNTFSSQDFTLISADDPADPFCAFQCHLSDGQLLVMGGAFYGGPGGQGIKTSWLFNPITEKWSRVDDMAFPRWYPTAVVLGDGKVLVASGRPASTQPVEEMEVYDPKLAKWTTLPATANKSLAIYPSLHLIPTGALAGKVLYSGTRWAGRASNWNPPRSAAFDPITNTWQDIAALNTANRTEGFSLMMPPSNSSTIMVIGGGHNALDSNSSSAEIIDLTQTRPQWQNLPNMSYERSNVNGVILPNGSVFVFGGHSGYKWDTDINGANLNIYGCEIFDPRTRTWSQTPAMQTPRQYHSIGILLPDGRILCSGGIFPGTGFQLNMEIYSPSYLSASRPVIKSLSNTNASYGKDFKIEYSNSNKIADVILIKPMAVTHQTDSSQSLIQLEFDQEDDEELEVKIPNNSNLITPGFYMVFIVDQKQIPSVAKFIHVGPRIDIDDEKENIRNENQKEEDHKNAHAPVAEDIEIKETAIEVDD